MLRLVGAPLGATLLVALITGCASRDVASRGEAYDPFEKVNRVVYKVNDFGDRYLLRPTAVGYRKALPEQLRGAVSNIFANLLYPVTIANDFLQGKFRQTGRDGARFLLNSTVGLAGIFDPATRVGLAENSEDFDQTLAVWGVPEGPYLVIPLFGPRTARHATGSLVDSPLTPFVNITEGDLAVSLGTWALYLVDGRSRLLDLDAQVQEAYDPYSFVRDAYLQNRRYKALDGNVPEDDAYLDDEGLDDDTGDAGNPAAD